jgi:alkylation response protein AidB-like acyl-CoA dehydrogenase
MENLEDFRIRANKWIHENLAPRGESLSDEALRERDALLQAKIYDAGFAGLAVPVEYGGQGLTADYQKVFADEAADFETPRSYMVSIGMMLPTLLDHGTEVVKRRHIPKMLRGEEIWIQLLSEPSGGSDMAGALTRASPQDEGYLINGSKMWSSGAGWSDYGLCLARVNWGLSKHAGLAMFAVHLKGEGVSINPIVPASGEAVHYFVEYFDNAPVHRDYRLGAEGEGWAVASRLLFHERNATAGVGFGYGLGGGQADGESTFRMDALGLARASGAIHDPAFASIIADEHIDLIVSQQMAARINTGLSNGKLQGQWASLCKLAQGIDSPLNAQLAMAVTGADGVIWSGDQGGGDPALNWLTVRGISIAGGSNEIQRNIVAERLMGLPREPGDDKNIPFNQLVSARTSK